MSLSTYYFEYGRHVARLRDSVVVMRTRPQRMSLAMITMRKFTHGFPFLSYISIGGRRSAINTTF